MKYVTKKMIVVINHLVTSMTGGVRAAGTNIRPGMNLGFVEQVHANTVFGQKIYPDIYHQAGAYLYFIIKNHVFHDGNKRTGLAAAVTFLEWNSSPFKPFNEDAVFDFVVRVAECTGGPEVVIPQIANWFTTLGLDDDPVNTMPQEFLERRMEKK